MSVKAPAREETKSAVNNAARHLLVKQTDSVFAQMFRFGMVGALATVVDVMILHVLADRMHVSHFHAVAAGFAAGTVVSYLLSVRWVFTNRTLSNPTTEFAVFGAVGVIGFLLTEWIVLTLVGMFGKHFLMQAKMVSVVTVFGWNFGARRLLLFRSGACSKDKEL